MSNEIPNDYIECDCGEHSHYVCVTHTAEDDWPCWLELGEVIVPTKMRWFGHRGRLSFIWDMLRGRPFFFHGVALTVELRDRLLAALECSHTPMTNGQFKELMKE